MVRLFSFILGLSFLLFSSTTAFANCESACELQAADSTEFTCVDEGKPLSEKELQELKEYGEMLEAMQLINAGFLMLTGEVFFTEKEQAKIYINKKSPCSK